MAKHNKKRNTAFIYETLVREVVKQSVEKNTKKRDIAIGILKESFKRGTQLQRELYLYKTLIETKGLPEKLAEKLLSETIKQHGLINQEELFKEQSKVISVVNKKISKQVFSNFVPNYKNLATIAQIFSTKLAPKTKVILESRLVESLMVEKKEKAGTGEVSNLVMKSFVKRFNETYGDLLEEQRETLSKYISSFVDDGTEFGFHLNEEVARLKKIIDDSFSMEEIQEDQQLKQKLNEIKSILHDFNQTPLDKEKLLNILKIQNLARELTS